MRVIDLSHTLSADTPVFPGDAPVRLERARELEFDGLNAYHLSSGLHAGTHIDAPMHMLEDARTLDAFPPDAFTGRGIVLDARGERVITVKPHYEDMIRAGDILLVCTGQDKLFGKPGYFADYPVLDMDMARFLRDKGIKLLGVDAPAPDKSPYDIHRLLLDADICLLENMTNLDALIGLPPFIVVAAPLKIRAEGSFTRALAIVAEP